MHQALSAAIGREAEALIRRYDFSADARVSLLSESENKVFLVSDPARTGRYVIRVNSGRLSYHTQESIASEMAWIMALGCDTDITVPAVLSATDGSLVQTLDAADLDKPRHAVIYSFLPGEEPSGDELSAGFERLGGISARMHRHAQSWTPLAGFRRHAWTPEEIFDDRYNWGPWRRGVGVDGAVLGLLSRLEDVLRDRLTALPRDADHFGLIHADLRLANLLVEDGRTAVIDFDDCGYGWYLFDLAAALSFLEERPDVPDLIAHWLAGYRRVADVPVDAEAAIPMLIMLRRLQLMGWVGYQYERLEFAREIGPQFTQDTCMLADRYLTGSL